MSVWISGSVSVGNKICVGGCLAESTSGCGCVSVHACVSVQVWLWICLCGLLSMAGWSLISELCRWLRRGIRTLRNINK